MRILFVCDSYPPTLGGLENHAAALARYLKDRHSIVVLTSKIEGLPKSEIENGIQVLRVLEIPQPLPIKKRLAAIESIRRWVNKLSSKFDLLHYHGRFTEAFWPKVSCTDIPKILTAHGHFIVCPKYTRLDWQGKVCTNVDSTLRCTKCMFYSKGFKAILSGIG